MIALAGSAAHLAEEETKTMPANPAAVKIKKPKKKPEGATLAVLSEPAKESGWSSAWKTVKKMLKIMGKEAAMIALAGGLAIAAAFLGLKVPPKLSELWTRDRPNVLPALCMEIAALVTGTFVLRYLGSSLMFASTEAAAARLREELFCAFLDEDVAMFDVVHSSTMVGMLTADVKELRDTMRSLLTEGLGQVATVVGGVGALFAASAQLSLVLSAAIPLGVAVGTVYAARLRRLSKESQAAQAKSASVASESLGNIRTLKAYSAETLEAGRYHNAVADASAASTKVSREISLFHSLIGFAMSGLAGATFLFGNSLVESGALEKAQLMSFILQAQTTARSLEGLSIQHTRLLQARAAFDRVTAVLASAEERQASRSKHHQARWDDFGAALRLQNVSFAYPSRPDTVVLRDVTLDIPAGKVVAIAGPSGSGKSSLAALLLGFYSLPEQQDNSTAATAGAGKKPSATAASASSANPFTSPPPSKLSRGLVTVDGRPLSMVDMPWYRRHCAYVPQDAATFNMSVRDNIAYGMEKAASDEDIIEAAKAAKAWQFIQQLPQGLDTVIHERGSSLSGGQRQRIALARALLRKPKLLVLDEYSSALDAETEHSIQEALAERFQGPNRTAGQATTVVVIAHRLSTIAKADKIVVMADGAVVETGSHDELVARKDGLYSSLARKQTQLGAALAASSSPSSSPSAGSSSNTDSAFATVMRERLASSSEAA